MPPPSPSPTRRQRRLLSQFAARSQALFDTIDQLPDRRAPLPADMTAEARSALADAERLLAGSGIVPGCRLPESPEVAPGALFVALLAMHQAVGRLMQRVDARPHWRKRLIPAAANRRRVQPTSHRERDHDE